MKKIKKNHVKIGDRVCIITGVEKGKIGNISFINQKKNSIVIDSISPKIKYTKNKEGKETKKVEIPYLFDISNVMLWDQEAMIASRTGTKLIKDNSTKIALDSSKKVQKKQRYFKKSGNNIS